MTDGVSCIGVAAKMAIPLNIRRFTLKIPLSISSPPKRVIVHLQ
jgi:hypothetical protein